MNSKGMQVLAVVFTDYDPDGTLLTRLEKAFLNHFGFVYDLEFESVDNEGTMYFNIDYPPVHAQEVRARELEMAAYIRAFLQGANIPFEVIGD